MPKLIDADEFKEFINWTSCKAPYSRKQVLMWIDMARPVDAVPVRHGKWAVPHGHPNARVCTVCKMICHEDNARFYSYCPNCGADMRELEG